MSQRLRSVSIAALGAAIAVAAIVVGRHVHLLTGWRAVILVALLIVLTPVSRNLSRRIMIVGALVVGWVPLVWWIDLWGFRDRMTWILALGVAAIVFWVLAGPRPGLRLRALVPKVRAADAITATAAVGAVWLLWPLMVAASEARSLTLLMKSGWDHVAHFFMASHMAATGSQQTAMGASPDGSDFVQGSYPRHFHILVNGMDELFSGPFNAIGMQEYGRATVLVLVLVVVMLVAALAELPGFLSRPLLAWPAITLAVGAVLLGPGTVALSAGFPNFVIACVFPVVCACVAVGSARVPTPLALAAMGGLIVATAHSWLLLVPLSVVAALLILVPWRPVRWRATRGVWAGSVAIVVATVAASLYAVVIAASSLSDATLTSGGVEGFPAGMTAMIVLAVLAAAALCLGSLGRSRGTAVRAGFAGVIALALALMLVAVGGRQLLLSGELTYYFAKLASAAGILGFGVLAVVVSGIRLGPRRKWARGRKVAAVAASALGTLAALQAFGYVGPSFDDAIAEKAPGMQYRSDAVILTSGESPEALRLLAAAELARERPFGSTLYLAVMPGDPLKRLANQWHLSLSDRWSVDAEKLGVLVDTAAMARAVEDGELAGAVQEILADEPGVSVIVAPEQRDEILPLIDAGLRDRLITW